VAVQGRARRSTSTSTSAKEAKESGIACIGSGMILVTPTLLEGRVSRDNSRRVPEFCERDEKASIARDLDNTFDAKALRRSRQNPLVRSVVLSFHRGIPPHDL
jgi:hypothetical protein